MTGSTAEERLAALATRWSAADDRRAVFADCYRLMTVRVSEGVREGRFEDGAWPKTVACKKGADKLNAKWGKPAKKAAAKKAPAKKLAKSKR